MGCAAGRPQSAVENYTNSAKSSHADLQGLSLAVPSGGMNGIGGHTVTFSDVDEQVTVSGVGAASSSSPLASATSGQRNASASLRSTMSQGREDIRRTQEKLNSSLTTPIVDKEYKVLESGSWLIEKKDVNHRFNLLPPIPDGKRVKGQAMAFTMD